MIVDELKNWKKYFTNPLWETVFSELAALDEKTPDGDTEITGAGIILKVFSYTTLDPRDKQALPESHRKYYDIHTSIIQSERIEWDPVSSLTVLKIYDAAEDETVYARPDTAAASILMRPGLFVLFGPDDAHRPRLHPAGGPQLIKKAVMKISVNIISTL